MKRSRTVGGATRKVAKPAMIRDRRPEMVVQSRGSLSREGTLGRESFGRVTVLGVEAILAALAESRCGKNRTRRAREARQGCRRLVAARSESECGALVRDEQSPGGRATRRSDSGVVKRSIPRSWWAQPIGCTQDANPDDEPGAAEYGYSLVECWVAEIDRTHLDRAPW